MIFMQWLQKVACKLGFHHWDEIITTNTVLRAERCLKCNIIRQWWITQQERVDLAKFIK